MKLSHKINRRWWEPIQSDPITPEYEREVQRDTARLEAAYRKAASHLNRAEAKLARARVAAPQVVEKLEALVEARRKELDQYRRLMEATPQSATHRGAKSFRPVGLGDK